MSEKHRLPTDTDDGLLVIISGPSGVGKTTITRGVERATRGAVFSVSVTTRPRAEGDVDGVDYWFVNRDEFQELIDEDALLEWAEVFGNRYGTPRAWVSEQLERGRVVILEIDVRGAKQVKEKMPDALGIFILPPDEQTLLDRLHNRKRESEEIIQRRFSEAKREIDEAHASGVYDRFITNNVLNDALAEALKAVADARQRVR